MTIKGSVAVRAQASIKPSFGLGILALLRDGLLDEKYFVQNIAFFLIYVSMQDARPVIIADDAIESV